MPAIPREMLGSVVYVYPSEHAARNGERIGGSGFLLNVKLSPPGSDPPRGVVYAVTNAHVIGAILQMGGRPTIRMNRAGDQGVELVSLARDRWVYHPDGDDLALARLKTLPATVEYASLAPELLLDPSEETEYEIGTETVMAGRFITHEGKQRNTPAVRFGHVAMLPHEPVLTEQGINQESFLVEVRSLPGYSGSPVFVYREIITVESTAGTEARPIRVRLLGIDYAHLGGFDPVLDEDKRTRSRPAQWVARNTAMMAVVPSWKLTDLLGDSDLVHEREQIADSLRRPSAG